MGAGPDPGVEPPLRVETVRQSARTRITRLVFADRTVIRKQPLGPDQDRRVRRETALLERVRGVDGAAQLVDDPGYADSILLADAGTTPLADLATPLAVDELIGLAVALARAVAGVHARAVLHRDIAPGNVVLSAAGAPTLVDFSLAALVTELRPGFSRPAEIVGTLAYLAPEATGRTGRPVDQRADLYALGALLYELATGAPPFGAGDPLELSRDHLARVPVPPTQVNPAVPGFLSEIVLHLLEKEPDRRYQTAEGLLFDLERLRDDGPQPADALPAGAHDRPRRLLAPSRLVGRDVEVAALHAALDDALTGDARAVFVGGGPGVGKTALVEQLRPVLAAHGGWYVAGKFDQYRRNLAASGVHQAFRVLGRLLLAEPEDQLAATRERIVADLGPNAGLMAAVVPEFATLLQVPADPGDPLTAQVRGQRNGIQILRAVASRERPVVLFLDDVQWASHTPLAFLDMILDDEPVEGLLVVCTYREHQGAGPDPLAARLPRWRQRAGVRHLRLEDLTLPRLTAMVADVLGVAPGTAAPLAEQLHPNTSGNPYVTMELLGALVREGVLLPTAEAWRWDPDAVHERLDRAEVDELLIARVADAPPGTRLVVETMACLGDRVEVDVLGTATGRSPEDLEAALAPALADGVLVAEPGTPASIRFRHDRIRDAVLSGIGPGPLRDLRLATARRLAASPDLFPTAAGQFLPLTRTPEVLDPGERRQAVALLRRAAEEAQSVADHAEMDALLEGALRLVDVEDTDERVKLHSGRLTALYSVGRLDEADEQYWAIEGLRPDVVHRAAAATVQVHTLTLRGRVAEAVELAVGLLRELGIAVPERPDDQDVAAQLLHLHRWLDSDPAHDLARPDIADPGLLAAVELIGAVLPAAFFIPDLPLYTWLAQEAPRILLQHGAARSLQGPMGIAVTSATVQRDEAYDVGYRAMRRVLALGEARGYEPETSVVRSTYATAVLGWIEPVENVVPVARRAIAGLVSGGELAWAAYAHQPAVVGMLHSAATIDEYVAEVETALAFMRGTGNEHTAQWFDSYRWVAAVLTGERPAEAGGAVGWIPPDVKDNPAAAFFAHVTRAVLAAIFGDAPELAHHSAAAIPLLPAARGLYPGATARLVRGLACAQQVKTADPVHRTALLAELDEMSGWLAARATDAPANFLHLLRLLEAERAWATGDFKAAATAFDAARGEVARQQRPWHRALITERAALFHLGQGLPHTGRALLAEARQAYAGWGATAKVAQLDWAQAGLGAAADMTGPAGADQSDPLPRPRSVVTTGTLDLLGILAASQALSSETSLERLHARVVEVLGALTGATAVHLLLWDQERQDWLLPTPSGSAPVGTDHETVVPLSVLRYVQRTGEPLVVADATADDRFARDPHLAGADRCSLLVLPIYSRGTLRALLLLENRLLKAAFSADRLDAVRLVAGQLAVSVDNAQLYAELTTSRARIVTAADQTRRRIERDLHDGVQQQLVALALRARTARASAPGDATELLAQLDDLAIEATSALDDLRELARGIHPSILTKGGLGPALHALARRCSVPVQLDVSIPRRLPEKIEIAAYYLVAEALTNTAKHAHATKVTVTVAMTGDGPGTVLRVRVRDDGCGGTELTRGTGLIGLVDRVEALGGRLVLQSPPGAGTTLDAELPVPDARRTPA
jgi:signal transduction histidine kinase